MLQTSVLSHTFINTMNDLKYLNDLNKKVVPQKKGSYTSLNDIKVSKLEISGNYTKILYNFTDNY